MSNQTGRGLVSYGVGSGRLGPSGLSGDDNLVNGQDGPGRLGGKPNGPTLGGQEIQNAILVCVKDARAVVVL